MIGVENREICFADLVNKYQEMMFYTALQILKDCQLAEDAVQEAWIKVFRFSVDQSKIDKISAWLRTVTSRTAIDMLRKENRSKMILLEEDINIEELKICSVEHVNEEMAIKGTFEEIKKCMDHSSDKLKSVFYLKVVKGYQDTEISSILKISESAVKTRLFRARKLIKQHYKVYNDIKPGA
ncbi:RNA polymerase sigma-70 factor, ECF subfamily [Gracilibacillus ureilyticus]|uniref:RNA polymerase sigma-70 factor, ECF subfamily n=1 Tax=Gracilibacillus ureilyticus TaxID=531814 RepID=A0A1H9TNQ6_9BACI|nr:RNA polymerase sigma factor [Gracilibacillus ureilyticus]SER98698.1 RNA polymerase sigma-70 factor, ECF subfamily [Gracilibacillus ureilyticus]